jgi:hypothetical protein
MASRAGHWNDGAGIPLTCRRRRRRGCPWAAAATTATAVGSVPLLILRHRGTPGAAQTPSSTRISRWSCTFYSYVCAAGGWEASLRLTTGARSGGGTSGRWRQQNSPWRAVIGNDTCFSLARELRRGWRHHDALSILRVLDVTVCGRDSSAREPIPTDLSTSVHWGGAWTLTPNPMLQISARCPDHEPFRRRGALGNVVG